MGLLNSISKAVFGSAPNAPGVSGFTTRSGKGIEETTGLAKSTIEDFLGFGKGFLTNNINPLIQDILQAKQNTYRTIEEYAGKTKITDQDIADQKAISKRIFQDATTDRTEEIRRRRMVDYESQSKRQEDQAKRLQARYGINPIATTERLNQQSARAALDKTFLGAQAEQEAKAIQDQAQRTALAVGADRETRMFNTFNQMANVGADRINTALMPYNLQQGLTKTALGGYGQMSNMYSQLGGIGQQVTNQANLGYQNAVNQRNEMISAAGKVAGFAAGKFFPGLADGGMSEKEKTRTTKMFGLKPHDRPGKVKGPGNGIDDKIPAMLSNGEYVIPADVVEKYGVAFFDSMVQNNHVPAAIQRQKMKDKENKHRKKQMKKTKGNVLGKKKLGLA